jgi:hypothetical protein
MSVKPPLSQPQTHRHFFEDAPVLSWMTWGTRWIYGDAKDPSELPTHLLEQPIHSPTGVQPTPTQPTKSREYSEFLRKYFYSASLPVALCVPPSVFEKELKGIELRDKDARLVGVVFCPYAGMYNGNSVGVITWLCVAPSWRGKGVTNCLLRSIYKRCQPQKYYLWRNDGWLKSRVPPIYSESRLVRKRQTLRTNITASKHMIPIRRISLGSVRGHWAEFWRAQHPKGLFLDDQAWNTHYTEAWERKLSSTKSIVVFLQPTFEVQRQTNESWAEILGYTVVGPSSLTMSEYEIAQNIEAILDSTPYQWFEAPKSLPHLEQGWQSAGTTTWCIFGLDPGIPVMRDVLSVCAF